MSQPRQSTPPPARPAGSSRPQDKRIAPRFGLWGRISIILLFAIPGAAALPAWASYRDTRDTVQRALTARAAAVTRAAASSAQFCVAGGETECARLVQVLLALDDVAWAVVMDNRGAIPIGASVANAPIGAAGLRRVQFHGQIPTELRRRDVWHGGEHFLSVIVPLERTASSGGNLGAIEIGFSLASRDRAVARALKRTLTVTGMAAIFALFAAFFVTRLLTSPLLEIARVSDAIARGDLRGHVQARSDDEIGLLAEAFNRILASMRATLEQIRDGSERIDRAAGELVQLMSEQRAGAGANLATVSATTAAISDIVASGAEMRQRGLAAVDVASRAIAGSEQLSLASHRALEESLREIDRIRTHVTQIAARVEELDARTQPLARVVETTADLADRLHDLSLGASQEAVVLDRAAGASGRTALSGLVADLRAQAREAQRAAAASRRTLSEVQQAMRRARTAADEGARAVETSAARTRTAESTLEQRGTAMRDISRALRQLSDLIQDQLGRIEQIFEGVEKVRAATSHFSRAADQTLGTARGLSRLAAELKQLLSRFHLR